jgi:hypothetical protein
MSVNRQLGPESRLSISPSVYARVFGSEIVLLDFGRGEYFGLDEVGAEIWRGIEAGDSLGEIATRLVERFEVAYEQALSDTVVVVDDMLQCDLVRPS